MVYFQTCLSRWRSEVEAETASLSSAIKSLEAEVDSAYAVPELQKMHYNLHAVMVHEGSMVIGHYWAFVFDRRRRAWLKFNDSTVTRVTWDELAKDCMGGKSNASAYKLIYLREDHAKSVLQEEYADLVGEEKKK